MTAIGRAVAVVRIERGMKRKDLVAAARISYPYLAEIEAGRKLPSCAMLNRIATALSLRASELLARAESIAADPRNAPVAHGATLQSLR